MNTWRRLKRKVAGFSTQKVLAAVSLALLALGLGTLTVRATNGKAFAVGNRAFGTTNGYAIVPYFGDRVAVVQTLSVTCDQAPGRIVVYSNGPPAIVVGDHALTVSNIMVLPGSPGGTNGLAAGDQLLLQTGVTPNDFYDRLRVVSVSTTNILIAVTSSVPITAGSKL